MTRKAKKNYKQMTCYRKVDDGLPHVEVYLDGELLSGCIKANSKRGFAVVYVHPYTARNGRWLTKKLRGKIKFKRVSRGNDGKSRY